MPYCDSERSTEMKPCAQRSKNAAIQWKRCLDGSRKQWDFAGGHSEGKIRSRRSGLYSARRLILDGCANNGLKASSVSHDKSGRTAESVPALKEADSCRRQVARTRPLNDTQVKGTDSVCGADDDSLGRIGHIKIRVFCNTLGKEGAAAPIQ